MSNISDIKQLIQAIAPLANFNLIEFPKRHSQELEVRIDGNLLIIEEIADGSYGVSVINSSEDIFESFFTPYPDIVLDSYEALIEYIIETLKCWNYEVVDSRNNP
jgi:hypothetical protein